MDIFYSIQSKKAVVEFPVKTQRTVGLFGIGRATPPAGRSARRREVQDNVRIIQFS